MQEEIWKPIPGYEDYYDASSKGNIRRSPNSSIIKGASAPGKLLSPTNTYYRKVLLSKDGKRRCWNVHKLVLMAFKGPRPKGYFALHKNWDMHDNNISNLYWAKKLVKFPSKNPRKAQRSTKLSRKLGSYGIREIRTCKRYSHSQKNLTYYANKYSIHPKTVSKIYNYESYIFHSSSLD